MSGVSFSTISQVLAQRAIDAQNGQGYVQPDRVALPGALRSLSADELDTHHAAGRATHEIADHVNAEWREVNKTRLAQRSSWVQREYLPGIQRRIEAAARAKAQEQRKRAAQERLIAREIAEHEGI